jgi:hypothetical protein
MFVRASKNRQKTLSNLYFANKAKPVTFPEQDNLSCFNISRFCLQKVVVIPQHVLYCFCFVVFVIPCVLLAVCLSVFSLVLTSLRCSLVSSFHIAPLCVYRFACGIDFDFIAFPYRVGLV